MKKVRLYACLLPISLFLSAVSVKAGSVNQIKDEPLTVEGRWDLTIHNVGGKDVPSWLEVMHSGRGTLIGRFVYAFGSARPVAHIKPANGKYSFSIPIQWEPGTSDMEFEFTMAGDSLTGSMLYTDGKKYNWSGVRAPSLRRTAEPAWGSAITLFNGANIDGWHAMGANQWLAEAGVLRSPKSGSNLVSDRSFTDFKLHIEFRYPKGSNSGVYLRGRYEVQIEDSKGLDPLVDRFSAIYGFLPPNEMAAKDAGEWQSYDITLVGRTVTVIANGKTVICNTEIPGITGGALNSKESEPGPLLIQGDHGPVEFRNIIITPAK
jgi:hypothetical protein